MRLEIGHQQGGGNSLPHNVADHQPELVPAQFKKIVKIASDVASLDADRRIFQGRKRRPFLREKPGLYVTGKFQLLAQAVLGFGALHMSLALFLHFAGYVLATEQRKHISVQVFKGGGNGAPGMHPRRMAKADAAPAPFLEFGKDVFGQKYDPGRSADEVVFLGAGVAEPPARAQPCHQEE
jgi:hypothetical protein